MENSDELKRIEEELLADPDILIAVNEHRIRHSHEGLGLGETRVCIICSVVDALSTLIAANDWMVKDENDVSDVVLGMTESTKDLIALIRFCAQAGTTLNLLGLTASVMVQNTLDEEQNG